MENQNNNANRNFQRRRGYSPMGYATKQEAYFAWRDDYDRWKDDNFGIPWGYRDNPPQWEDYWCDEEWIPYNSTNEKTDISNGSGCLAFCILLISCITIGFFI